MSERAVEIAIIWEEVKKYDAERVLEVGNTLSYYYPVRHDIVDQFDKAERVINVDIVDFFTPKKYDLIVSISTMEHIGKDEGRYTGGENTMSESPDKIIHAVDKLKNFLNQKGRIIITAPLGYNQTFDTLLKGGLFTNKRYLRRISKNNRWVEIDESGIGYAKYNEPFKLANVLAICSIENP
jgi:cyclopropane fatty-acyl-phospholipid synthase-like methyltransferase